jgi:hypothetical protein
MLGKHLLGPYIMEGHSSITYYRNFLQSKTTCLFKGGLMQNEDECRYSMLQHLYMLAELN